MLCALPHITEEWKIYITLIKSDSEDIYNASKDFCFKKMQNYNIYKRILGEKNVSLFSILMFFFEQQISILEWFLKDHVRPKIWVIAETAKNSALHHQ